MHGSFAFGDECNKNHMTFIKIFKYPCKDCNNLIYYIYNKEIKMKKDDIELRVWKADLLV